MKTQRIGFTLTELLTVIAIVGIVAAIALPVIGKARETGRKASCASSLHQLGLALVSYVGDNDERLPTTAFPSFGGPVVTNSGWAGQVYPHVRSVSVFRCPDDPTADITYPGAPDVSSTVSYAINNNFRSLPASAQIAAPARTVLLFEVNGDTAILAQADEAAGSASVPQTSAAGNGVDGYLANLNGGANSGALPNNGDGARYATGFMDNHAWANPSPITRYENTRPRHADGANFLAADGHSVWLPGSRVSAGAIARHEGGAQALTGCQPFGGPGGFPCAEGTNVNAHALTFSPL